MGYSVKTYYPTESGYYLHQTCFWCYFFVPSHRRKGDLPLVPHAVKFTDGHTGLVYKFKADNQTFYFDPDDEEGWGHVRAALVDGLEGDKLASCCREAVSCCNKTLDRPAGEQGRGGCPATWDGWLCFPDTPAGATVTFTCPSYAYAGYPECALEGRKKCDANGSWAVDGKGTEMTEYATCSHHHYHLTAHGWEAFTHSISLLALPPAIALILNYRHLRVQRFYLHLNLFLALLGKAIFNLLELLLIRVPEYTGSNNLLDANTGGCRALVFLAKVFNLAVWTWMLAESLYLHRLIVAAFRGGGKTWVYLLVGWVPAAVVGGAWAASKAVVEDTQCWLGDDLSTSHDLFLILDIPKLLILLVNVALLANMTRVLLTKLRGVNADRATATRSTVKATMFLVPMFGLQFLLTLYLPPPPTPCTLLQVYFFVATAVDGLQGLYVAVVYCFINKEVRLQVRRSVYRLRGRLHLPLDQRSSAVHDPRTDVSLLSTSQTPTSPTSPTSRSPLSASHNNSTSPTHERTPLTTFHAPPTLPTTAETSLNTNT